MFTITDHYLCYGEHLQTTVYVWWYIRSVSLMGTLAVCALSISDAAVGVFRFQELLS